MVFRPAEQKLLVLSDIISRMPRGYRNNLRWVAGCYLCESISL